MLQVGGPRSQGGVLGLEVVELCLCGLPCAEGDLAVADDAGGLLVDAVCGDGAAALGDAVRGVDAGRVQRGGQIRARGSDAGAAVDAARAAELAAKLTALGRGKLIGVRRHDEGGRAGRMERGATRQRGRAKVVTGGGLERARGGGGEQ